MNAYVSISEANNRFVWLGPDEQYSTPPPHAICWVAGVTDEELLAVARAKFEGIGFKVVSVSFYSPGPGGRAIHLVVEERPSETEIVVGDSALSRVDTAQSVMH